MTTRKLQAEIERTLKKIQEGAEVFQALWDKVYAAESRDLMLKHEADLKKELKKQQRLRDQLKNWISNPEIKDKSEITAAKKLIESDMERFKVCEREAKTKAFSNDALSGSAKLDPEEKKKRDVRNWANTQTETLTKQLEIFEADLEELSMKKRRSGNENERVKTLENLIERHKKHIDRLEQMLRFVDNGALDTETANAIREDVEYYVSDCQEPDFYLEDDDIYEQLDLDRLARESGFAIAPQPRLTKKSKDESGTSSTSSTAVSSSGTRTKDREETSEKKDARDDGSTGDAAAKRSDSVGSSTAPSAAKSKQEGRTNTRSSSGSSLSGTSVKVADKSGGSGSQAGSSGKSGVGGAAAGVTVVPGGATAPTPLPFSEVLAGGKTEKKKTPEIAPRGKSFASAVAQSVSPAVEQPSSVTADSGASGSLSAPPSSSSAATSSASAPVSSSATAAAMARASASSMRSSATVKQSSNGQERAKLMLQRSHAALRSSARDADAHRAMANPVAVPSFFPTEVPPALNSPQTFARLDVDTLFFAFYFEQGSYHQFLAAQELKRHSWRYHKLHNSWFQRHDEPEAAFADYEKGTYVYFDHEKNWEQRVRRGFVFEYKYLEDELQSQ